MSVHSLSEMVVGGVDSHVFPVQVVAVVHARLAVNTVVVPKVVLTGAVDWYCVLAQAVSAVHTESAVPDQPL